MLAPKSLHFYEKKKKKIGIIRFLFCRHFQTEIELSFISTACVDIIVIELCFSGKIESIIHEGKKL